MGAVRRALCASVSGVLTLLLGMAATPGAVADEVAAGTHVGGVLAEDTVWTADGGPYLVDDVVQIPTGVTLRIEQGTQVHLTRWRPQMFLVAGTLDATGTAEDPVEISGWITAALAKAASSSATYPSPATVGLRHVHASTFGAIVGTGGGGYGRYEILDSAFTRMGSDLTYVWYPTGHTRIERNIFAGNMRWSIGFDGRSTGTGDGTVTMANNRFRGNYSIESWAAYGGALQVHGNSFEPATSTILTLSSDGAIDATGNDWGTTDPAAVAAKIHDGADNVNLTRRINVEPLLPGPDPQTPALPPLEPVNVTATSADGDVQLDWDAPLVDGGAPVVGYTVTAYPSGQSVDVPADQTNFTLPTPGYGNRYDFEVSAHTNAGSSGPASAWVEHRESTAPSVTIAEPLDGQLFNLAQVSDARIVPLRFTGSDPVDAAADLNYQCYLNYSTPVACTGDGWVASPAVVEGRNVVTVDVRDPSGNAGSASTIFNVDTVAPTASLIAPRLPTALDRVHVGWTWPVDNPAVASDLRRRVLSPTGVPGSWISPASWQRLTVRSQQAARPAPGTTACFSARVYDDAGNVSSWAPARCTTSPFDDRQLTASRGWVARRGAGFAGTTRVSSRRGASLTSPRVRARGLVLVASRHPGAGTVGVYLGGVLQRKVNLAARTRYTSQQISVASYSRYRTGRVTVRVLNPGSRGVEVDAVVAPQQ